MTCNHTYNKNSTASSRRLSPNNLCGFHTQLAPSYNFEVLFHWLSNSQGNPSVPFNSSCSNKPQTSLGSVVTSGQTKANGSDCYNFVGIIMDKISVDKMSADKMSADKMSVDKMSVDKMPVDKMHVDEMPVDKMSYKMSIKMSKD